MIRKIISLFSGRHYKQFVRRCQPIVARVNEIEKQYQALTDEQLRAKTEEFRARFQQGETLDQLLPEAFAAAKNAARRLCGQQLIVCDQPLTWNMVHYDVQIIGGVALHERKIAEMATGEGKTLVSTLRCISTRSPGATATLSPSTTTWPAATRSGWVICINSSASRSLHQQQQSPDVRRQAYGSDITYGTASEFGFDYLRDNGMATRIEDQVQRGHYYCIVDEVDSILVDEARTPLIITGPSNDDTEGPFLALKPAVESLYNLQLRLCNRLAQEAKDEFEKPNGDQAFAARKMLQVKMGHAQAPPVAQDDGERPVPQIAREKWTSR